MLSAIDNLITALGQYDRRLADEYRVKINNHKECTDAYEDEIIDIIKNRRWLISQSKRDDREYDEYINKYMVEKEDGGI